MVAELDDPGAGLDQPPAPPLLIFRTGVEGNVVDRTGPLTGPLLRRLVIHVKATALDASDLPGTLVAAAEAEVRRAQAQLELLKAGARPETIAGARAEMTAAEASLAQAQAALADTELKAPFAGTVASLDAKVGEQVSPGVPVAVLADLSAWQIETDDLTELNIIRVKEGEPVIITFDAIPDLELPGTVVRIKESGENKMGDMTYTVVIEPDQQDDRLRWNMTATVVIEPESS